MSITHRLRFKTQSTKQQILEALLSSGIGLQSATYDEMKADGMFGRVSPIEKDAQKELWDEFQLQTNMTVSFDETFEGNRDLTLKIMGDVFAFLLSREQGDVMLFWVIDTLILKRRDGQIQVTNEPEFDWLTNALDKVGLIYEPQSVQTIRIQNKCQLHIV